MANRLAAELSPYLLQHAHNPVDWWPWNDEAIAEARRRDVPIFLSIGYSTCYWCHVMERESFENPDIARSLAEGFVSIKVDREERPDIDDVYMAATLMLSGRGGWPMTCFLEPHTLRPFFCGTYYPPATRGGMMGFPELLQAISKIWTTRRHDVQQQAAQVAAAVQEELGAGRGIQAVGAAQITAAVQVLLATFDRVHAGFGHAPKFPQSSNLDLLLEVRQRAGDDSTADAVEQAVCRTLDAMANGGIHDHLGGGFHRYAVDAAWTVPHFEKMLYDNALLAWTYTRAASHFQDSFYASVARSTLDYLLTDMLLPGGGFASAEDAEVEHREGLNYLWTPDQVRAALPDPLDAQLAINAYSLDAPANFRDPHHPSDPPRWVLRMSDRPERIAAVRGKDPVRFAEDLARVSRMLMTARRVRPSPRRDDKVIVAWNGLALRALARAGVDLAEPRFTRAARTTAEFILTSMRTESGGLRRIHRAGVSKGVAALDDYAFLTSGLLELHAAGESMPINGKSPLEHAVELTEQVERRFATGAGDADAGYFDAEPSPDQFVRPRSLHDGAIPSGSAFMLHNLIQLGEFTGRREYVSRARALARSMSGFIVASPHSAVHGVAGLLRLLVTDPEAAAILADAPSPAPELAASSVEIYADRDRVVVGPEQPAEINLVIRIPAAQHIYAPSSDGTSTGPYQALRVDLIQGTGISVYADYPPGTPWAADPSVDIYEGDVELRIALEAQSEWSGRPLVGVWFQACTDRECFAPSRVELDVAIDPAG